MSPSAIVAEGARKPTLTRDQVIERILRWNALYGEPPCTADWNPSLARWRAQEWRIERYYEGDPETGEAWPALNTAKRLFGGSFAAAVRDAGLVPHRPGPRRRAPRAALPDVEQRAPRAPRDIEAELTAAAERVVEAERRALRAEKRTRRALARAERAEAQAGEVRARAAERIGEAREHARRVHAAERRPSPAAREAERRARDAERRAALAEEAVRELESRTGALERELAIAEAETRAANARAEAGMSVNGHARAAERRAIASASASAARRAEERLAARQAEAERDRAIARAEAAERRLRELTGAASLPASELAALRRGRGAVGPGPLGDALKLVAAARSAEDRAALHDALTQAASAAVRWRDRL